MENLSIQEQLNMLYDDYVKYLLQKYGIVQGNYFLTPSCKSRNMKISRTNEGLNIHHIDEDKIILLSKKTIAQHYPFEHQLADRLVYANLLEHLLLHIKIAEEAVSTEIPVGIGGIAFILRDINDYFGSSEEPSGWRLNVFNAIRNQYNDYLVVLDYIYSSENLYFSKENLCSGQNVLYDKILSDLSQITQ